MTTVGQTVFTLEQVPTGSGEWHRQTICPHGALEAGVHLLGWPDLAEQAVEAFATHQACFACDCRLVMGTSELPARPVHVIERWPSGEEHVVDEPVAVR